MISKILFLVVLAAASTSASSSIPESDSENLTPQESKGLEILRKLFGIPERKKDSFHAHVFPKKHYLSPGTRHSPIIVQLPKRRRHSEAEIRQKVLAKLIELSNIFYLPPKEQSINVREI
ncbi:unnamed protein product [Caenorhabditis angaria]|uniref:Uncharacterized protein n=1 Tax=Caenorhabditis angaria TaxID=860376 RepID=A0A9P1IC92_9PELO|nr:unnamed protein product [Caenorhabditis angaria]